MDGDERLMIGECKAGHGVWSINNSSSISRCNSSS